jgi:hypothetical protein
MMSLMASWQKHRTEHQEYEEKENRDGAYLEEQAQTRHR